MVRWSNLCVGVGGENFECFVSLTLNPLWIDSLEILDLRIKGTDIGGVNFQVAPL